MNQPELQFSSGIPSLDKILQKILPGDNVVWQVDFVSDYIPFVRRFENWRTNNHKPIIYFRFAQHPALLEDSTFVKVYLMKPEKGFEVFLSEILRVIEKEGIGGCYIFDCLSDLAVDWFSDEMLANFFMITCPYLYELKTVAYFALLRNHNSAYTIKNIQNTAQVIIDIYRHEEDFYLHPLKVENRFSTTLYMLHHWINSNILEKENFIPVVDSSTSAAIFSKIVQPWLDFSSTRMDQWTISFKKAQDILKNNKEGKEDPINLAIIKSHLLRMFVARDPQRLELAEKYFDIEDLLNVGKRLIGTGLIGGKSVGMLIARSILIKSNVYWKDRLEPHDSFYIGSDVFYTFLVRNKIWWMRRKLTNPNSFLEGIGEASKKIMQGQFPSYIIEQFIQLLNYFGQSPIIVRSSSLLEDAYGNSFSGKYESVFCANQGTPEERLNAFLNAVRIVYASTISHNALTYRKKRDLLDKDEEMAILVQRVSGTIYNGYFFPQLAGVGFSFNPFVWNHKIDPKAGVLRLVFGLGTRAVERTEDDYTRIVPLNIPSLRLESSLEDFRRYSQKKVDIIDLKRNEQRSAKLEEIVEFAQGLNLSYFTTIDEEQRQRLIERGRNPNIAWVLTFDEIFKTSDFTKDMQNMMQILQTAYGTPIDIEFTANFQSNTQYKINLLQCRTFQIKRDIVQIKSPVDIPSERIILKCQGPIIGNSVATLIDRIIYVDPTEYSKLTISDRYNLAHLIGRITHLEDSLNKKIMLLGPGRWGTTTPSLGIPVTFSEISSVSLLGEIAELSENFCPDVSLGTHFFNDIVECNMIYFAIYPDKKNNILNREYFKNAPSRLEVLLPNTSNLSHAIKVIDFIDSELKNESQNQQIIHRKISIYMNSYDQEGICYLDFKK